MNANCIEIPVQGKVAIIDAETYPQKHHDHGLVQVSYYKRKFRRELRKAMSPGGDWLMRRTSNQALGFESNDRSYAEEIRKQRADADGHSYFDKSERKLCTETLPRVKEGKLLGDSDDESDAGVNTVLTHSVSA